MTTNTVVEAEASLREEDLAPGKAFVHPRTKLEYADFHAFLAGKDPLPHWRNARIKEVHAQAARGELRWSELHIDTYIRYFDRDGRSGLGDPGISTAPVFFFFE